MEIDRAFEDEEAGTSAMLSVAAMERCLPEKSKGLNHSDEVTSTSTNSTRPNRAPAKAKALRTESGTISGRE